MNTKIFCSLLLVVGLFIGTTAAWAGATYGARESTSRVGAYGTDRYRAITFSAGEQAVVLVEGDGDTELQLLVYDQNNHLIASDRCQIFNCVATWIPDWTGPFVVVVNNLGSVYNEYTMGTN